MPGVDDDPTILQFIASLSPARPQEYTPREEVVPTSMTTPSWPPPHVRLPMSPSASPFARETAAAIAKLPDYYAADTSFTPVPYLTHQPPKLVEYGYASDHYTPLSPACWLAPPSLPAFQPQQPERELAESRPEPKRPQEPKRRTPPMEVEESPASRLPTGLSPPRFTSWPPSELRSGDVYRL
jgi:hypothetical protein